MPIVFENIKSIYRKELFFPKFIGLFTNPFYLARSGLVAGIHQLAPQLTGQLLDIGCGTKPYKSLFVVSHYVGLDIDSPLARARGIAEHFYDGAHFPFEDSSFSSALCNQVFEHVFNPEQFLSEIYRVLKPGGRLLLTVPFIWDEHEQPYDFARYSSFGLRSLLEKQGFKIIENKKIGADCSVIFQLINAYLYKITQQWPLVGRVLVMLSVMSLINLLGLLTGKLLPDNPDLFLDNIVLAEKL